MKEEQQEQVDYLLYRSLKARIIYHKYLYYVLYDTGITDQEYDQLERRFELKAAELKLPGSWVGWRSQDEVSIKTIKDVLQDKRETFD